MEQVHTDGEDYEKYLQFKEFQDGNSWGRRKITKDMRNPGDGAEKHVQEGAVTAWPCDSMTRVQAMSKDKIT